MITEGDQAPDFELPGSSADGRDRYALADYVTDGPAVLTFYPFDFSPICSTQLCEFQDVEWFAVEDDVDVLGISADSAYAHQAFIEEYGLTFPLLSDWNTTVCEQYGAVQNELDGHHEVPKRSIFVVDDTRTVEYRWERDGPTERPNIDAVGAAVKAARS
jgi:peroxiredoxin